MTQLSGDTVMIVTLFYFIFIVSNQGKIRQAGNVASIREDRKVYKVLVGKSEGKTPLGRPTMGSEWILGR